MQISILLTKNTLNTNAVVPFLLDDGAGGINMFVGTTRRWTGSDETVELEYDCYEPLAETVLRELAEEAGKRWPIRRLWLHHRLGVVPAGAASVVVGVSTPHRAEAFAACRFLIDTLKQQVPIWKREVYADGRTEWVEGDRPPAVPRQPDAG